MQSRLLPLVLLLIAISACGENEQPTMPSSTDEPGGPALVQAAAQKVVNSAADPGNGICNASQCTLREAIEDPASTLIDFAPGLTGPIVLASPANGGGPLVIEKGLTIRGPSTRMVIRRANTSPEFRIMRTDSDEPVRLSNLEIRNGRTDGVGGGIVNFGALFLTNCVVAGNASSGRGGGIDNNGPLTIIQSTISDNAGTGISNSNNHSLSLTNTTVARNTSVGISNSGGAITLTRSTVAANLHGGISMSRGNATLVQVRVVDNSTTFIGGGILLVNGTMAIRNSNVTRNSAVDGGGIANRNDGSLTITSSTIWNNSATDQGGGIYNADRVRGSPFLRLTNSTVSGNSARSAGGIYNSAFLGTASATLTNSTVAFNSASEEGGGINQEFDQAVIGLRNTLVARNSAPQGPDVLIDPQGSGSASFSLIGNGTGSGISDGSNGNQVGNNASPIDPKIGPLADNGGLTRTHALLAGSPAIDAASSANCPPVDQRGVSRPQGAGCDIGSYERE